MKPRCSHVWEVEAARDGRLQGDALRAQEAHRESCEVCGAESRALDELVARCKELEQQPIDEVALRRARDELLQRADAQVTHRGRRGPGRAAWLFAAAAMAVAAVLWLVWPRALPMPESTNTALEVHAEPGPGARWNRQTTSAFETFHLEHGILSLRVRRPPGARQVVVQVPDGTIEDRGTVFEVEVRGGKTERVSVEEGAVRIALQGGVDEVLHAGEVWRRPAQPVASAVASPERRASESSNPAERKALRVPNPPVKSSEPSTVSDPAEDVAYLHVIQLLRTGKRREARVAARSYVREFPNGFRREEMIRVASGAQD